MWIPWGPGEVPCIQWNPSIVDTLGRLVKCPVYSGIALLWTPWGPGEVSCIQWTPLVWTPWGPGEVPSIQWNPSIVDTLGTW